MWRLLVALLSLACADAKWLDICFSAKQLEDGQEPRALRSWTSRWQHHSHLNMVSYLEKEQPHHGYSCPILTTTTGDLRHKDISERSISPWRYHINEKENRVPSKLAFAKCLCKGCINGDGQETNSLNSVPVNQTMTVLQRKPCQTNDGSPGFQFEVEDISIPVACTCAFPKTQSSN